MTLKMPATLFTVVPGGTLDICYIPNGAPTSKLGAMISLWETWDDADPPSVSVDVYVTAETNRA